MKIKIEKKNQIYLTVTHSFTRKQIHLKSKVLHLQSTCLFSWVVHELHSLSDVRNVKDFKWSWSIKSNYLVVGGPITVSLN